MMNTELPAPSGATTGAAPVRLLQRTLPWRLGTLAALTVVVLGWNDWRAWRRQALDELPATAALVAQLLDDDLARRSHSFTRAELGVGLAPLARLGRRVPFCADIQDITGRRLARGCLADDEAVGEEGSGRLAGWVAAAAAAAADGPPGITLPLTLPGGLKAGAVTVQPHWAGEAPLLLRRWGVLVAVGGALSMLLVLASRMTASRLAERWTTARRQQQMLATHLLQAREAERRRLARELHDEMGQSLAALQAEAAAMSLMTSRSLPEAARSAQAMSRTTAQLLEGLQRVLADLRPQALDRFGLPAALRSLVELPRRRPDGSELEARLAMQEPWPPLPPDHDVHVYRIVQEALTNAQRHSRARHADVTLACEAGELRLTVRDDAPALGAAEPPAGEADPAGHGLLGLRERVLALGGRAEWDAPPDGGWRLSVRLPLASAPWPAGAGEAA